jgi:uncharacterized protein GlcG (DUF336 family)
MTELTIEAVTAMIGRGRNHAESLGVAMTLAVVDRAGHLVAFARMDAALLATSDVALKKAKTAVLFDFPSEALWELCKPGGPAPGIEHTNGGLIPFSGGLPIHGDDGQLLGAIGVSGGRGAQDVEVANVAVGPGRP